MHVDTVSVSFPVPENLILQLVRTLQTLLGLHVTPIPKASFASLSVAWQSRNLQEEHLFSARRSWQQFPAPAMKNAALVLGNQNMGPAWVPWPQEVVSSEVYGYSCPWPCCPPSRPSFYSSEVPSPKPSCPSGLHVQCSWAQPTCCLTPTVVIYFCFSFNFYFETRSLLPSTSVSDSHYTHFLLFPTCCP